MIEQALQYLVGLGRTGITTVHDLPYTQQALRVVEPPAITPITVSTLESLTVLIGQTPGRIIVTSESHVRFRLFELDAIKRGQTIYVAEKLAVEPFPWGRYLAPEEFIIALHTKFVPDVGVDNLIRIASGITSNEVFTSTDDGVSQRVELSKGMATKAEALITPRVRLAPYRTFTELEQPISDFIFRLKAGANSTMPAACTLFEADGGKWRAEAMASIANFFRYRQLSDKIEAGTIEVLV